MRKLLTILLLASSLLGCSCNDEETETIEISNKNKPRAEIILPMGEKFVGYSITNENNLPRFEKRIITVDSLGINRIYSIYGNNLKLKYIIK